MIEAFGLDEVATSVVPHPSLYQNHCAPCAKEPPDWVKVVKLPVHIEEGEADALDGAVDG